MHTRRVKFLFPVAFTISTTSTISFHSVAPVEIIIGFPVCATA